MRVAISLLAMVTVFTLGVSLTMAAPISLTPTAPTYTYNPRAEGADGDATVSGVTFTAEPGAAFSSFYQPTTGPNVPGTVTYTFNNTGAPFDIATLTVSNRATIFGGFSFPGRISGTYSVDGGPAVTFFDTMNVTTGVYDDIDTFDIPVYGDSVTLQYTLTALSSEELGVQLFRSGGVAPNSPGDFTFSATATFTPEPASVMLWSLIGMVAIGSACAFRARRSSWRQQ